MQEPVYTRLHLHYPHFCEYLPTLALALLVNNSNSNARHPRASNTKRQHDLTITTRYRTANMKLVTIISAGAILTGALANTALHSAHAVADLLARAMDPATMDPTKLSILSVLKTAMPSPTGTVTDIVLPTGDPAPQWYKDLPADVMVLLAQMYPATPTAAAAVSETAAASANTSSSSAQETASASPTALTSTLELAPTATAAANGSLATGGSGGAPNNASATLSTGQPGPTQSALSTGAKNMGGTGMWSVAMGAGVAAIFCFFA